MGGGVECGPVWSDAESSVASELSLRTGGASTKIDYLILEPLSQR